MKKILSQKTRSAFDVNDSLAIKGIAIIIMMFYHCFMEPARFEGYTVDFWPLGQDLVMEICFSFKICVSLFAFVSGYGLYLSAKNKCSDGKSTEKWVITRLIKTLSGFWFVYILVFVITQVFANYPYEVYCDDGMIRGGFYAILDFFGLANMMNSPSMLPTWWYMSAAIIFIVLIPVIIKWIDKFGTVTLLIAAVAGVRLACGGYPSGTNAFAFILPLIFGLLFAKYDLFKKIDDVKLLKNKYLNYIAIFVLSCLILVVGYYIFDRVQYTKYWEYHYGIYPIIFICFCKKYIIRIPIIDKMLAFCGKHSMNVFLIHTFLRYTFFPDFIYSFKHFLLIVAVLLGISLAISALIIEPLKKLVRFDKLMDKLSNKLCGMIEK